MQSDKEEKEAEDLVEEQYLGVGKCGKCGTTILTTNKYQKIVIHSYDNNIGKVTMKLLCDNDKSIADNIMALND